MDTNNFLSFARIQQVMKREIMENWKTNMFRLIGLYAAFLVPLILRMWDMSGKAQWFDNPEWALGNFCQTIVSSFLLITAVLSFIYASGIMENMATKEKRIAFLMLPATMIEKFVARFLYVTVGLLVAIFVAISLAEVTRLLLLPLFDVPETLHGTVLPKIAAMFMDVSYENGTDYFLGAEKWGKISLGLIFVLLWVNALWNHSLFILGGNLWYKKPFFKTLGIMLLIGIFFSTILTQIVSFEGFHAFGQWLDHAFGWMTPNQLIVAGIVFFSIFTLFNWWLSYRLFTRSQIIKSKFHLL